MAEYERFERAAATAMAVHGGRIERVLRREHPAEEAGDEPFEVHLISFPDAADFHAYRHGAAAAALRPLRERVIERTTVFAARDHPPPEPAEHEPGAG